MGINLITAAAAQQSASREIEELDKKGEEKRTEEKNLFQRLLSSKEGSNKGGTILSDLVSKLGGNFKLSGKAETGGKAKDEYDLHLENKENFDDKVDLGSLKNSVKKTAKFMQKNHEGRQENSQGESDKNIKGNAKDYASVYGQMVLQGGGEIKKKLSKMEQRLMEQGVAAKDILGLQQNAKNIIRAQLAAQIKEQMIKMLLSPEKSLEKSINTKGVHNLVDFAFVNKELGGWDFGGYHGHLEGAANEQQRQAMLEIQDFVKEEIERNIVSDHLGDEKADDKIKDLIKLGLKVGVDMDEFKRGLGRKLDNLGMVPAPEDQQKTSSHPNDSSGWQQERNRQYEYDSEDEKELLINQLRALYMQRALRGDFRTIIETSFKLRRLKNGLMKLGVQFEDFDKVQKEGLEVARHKVMKMLEEALYERATLYQLSGPAFQLIEKKIKGLLSNLARLGKPLSRRDFETLRDDINRRMFEVVRQEFERDKALYQSRPNPQLEKKLLLLIKLIERLKKESNIMTSFAAEVKFRGVVENG